MACRDCKNCTNSSMAHAGRKLGRWTAGITTMGMSELAMATRKKCRACGHQMSLHGVDEVGGAVQPTVIVQQVPTAAPASPPAQIPAGWYYPEGPQGPPRWWDGTQWIMS